MKLWNKWDFFLIGILFGLILAVMVIASAAWLGVRMHEQKPTPVLAIPS